jgi:hypothetical protein
MAGTADNCTLGHRRAALAAAGLGLAGDGRACVERLTGGQFPAIRSKFPTRLDKFPVRRNKIPCSDF